MTVYDIAIIGGGVIGCAIARWMSKYKLSQSDKSLKILLIEKTEDVCSGTSKANSGIIHSGYAAKGGSLKCKLNVIGNPMFTQAYEELNFEFRRVGSFVVAVKDSELAVLEEEKKKGDERKISGEIITDVKRIKAMEPNIIKSVKGVYFTPTAGLVWPFGLTIALAENSHANGVNFLFSSPVTDIKKSADKFEIRAGATQITADYIINAAGLYADDIANMVGLNDFTITARKGEYILLDKNALDLNHILFPIPTKFSKGILVCPTVHGNTFIGPNSNLQDEKEDISTTSQGLNEIIGGAKKMFPNIPLRTAITNFAGLRAISSRHRDFIIEASEVEGFVNVAGICSPGLSSCLSIAESVVGIMREDIGLDLAIKNDWNPYRKPPTRLLQLSDMEISEAIRKNPQWGRVICRCETVTEAEIVKAIRGDGIGNAPLGARSLDMIKKRLRPGMGRCQGAFCIPKMLKILSRELKIPIEQVTKNVKGSEIIVGRTKFIESNIWEGDNP